MKYHLQKTKFKKKKETLFKKRENKHNSILEYKFRSKLGKIACCIFIKINFIDCYTFKLLIAD